MEGMLGKMAEMKSGAYDKDLKLLGYGAGEFAKAMNEDAQTAINDFLKRVKELPKDQEYPFLTALFGRNYNDDVMLLANSVDEYTRQQKLLTEVDASGNNKYLGSMTREFENRSKTTANQMFLLKSQLTHLGISVGSVLLPAIAETIGMLMPLVLGSLVGQKLILRWLRVFLVYWQEFLHLRQVAWRWDLCLTVSQVRYRV